DEEDWLMRGDRLDALVAPDVPLGPLALPINGRARSCIGAPGPPLVAPELLALVAAVVDEAREVLVRHRRARDAEGGDANRVSPLLIVEDEMRRVGARAEIERAAGDLGVARPRSGLRRRRGMAREARLGVRER